MAQSAVVEDMSERLTRKDFRKLINGTQQTVDPLKVNFYERIKEPVQRTIPSSAMDPFTELTDRSHPEAEMKL